MTTSRKPCPPSSNGTRKGSRKRVWLAAAALALAIGALTLAARTSLEQKSMIACIGYAVIVSVFLAAQVWGFVASQTLYSESVEAPKFRVIDVEEAEWAARPVAREAEWKR